MSFAQCRNSIQDGLLPTDLGDNVKAIDTISSDLSGAMNMPELGRGPDRECISEADFMLHQGQLETRWLTQAELRSVLHAISYAWFRHLLRPPFDDLGIIRRDVWEAECKAHPFPDVAVCSMGDVAVGVLSGYRFYGQKYFLIENIALHPGCPAATQEVSLDIAQALVTSAIDLSVSMGCYGWLAVSPDEKSRPFWVKLGFSKHDEFTYRKMGYFRS